MKRYTAWVITWQDHITPRILHGVEIGTPLALVPKKAYVEGAMVVAYQMLLDSAPSVAVAALGNQPRDEVEWDHLKENAKIGVGLEVWAHHADVVHHPAPAGSFADEGTISYKHSKWTDPRDVRELALALEDFDAAREQLRTRTSAWPPL
ncbi:hypothetical protein [Promicromonospora iranensis]|uniref:Uncharacterized protein n=1 Tax=Promicromonospora iranensis TaxID=1105144 RepID=A0ABU2CQI3_9MICO|nr:hypothetical protein [Promicromonospora iranensis]MDR7383600.1 hypothetical protein [Promicromonospora iranensis]